MYLYWMCYGSVWGVDMIVVKKMLGKFVGEMFDDIFVF